MMFLSVLQSLICWIKDWLLSGHSLGIVDKSLLRMPCWKDRKSIEVQSPCFQKILEASFLWWYSNPPWFLSIGQQIDIWLVYPIQYPFSISCTIMVWLSKETGWKTLMGQYRSSSFQNLSLCEGFRLVWFFDWCINAIVIRIPNYAQHLHFLAVKTIFHEWIS